MSHDFRPGKVVGRSEEVCCLYLPKQIPVVMEQERADTVPGFTMQSENFYLKFITGLQCGVSSRLLEYETDWYEVMEIILSRLQDEQEDKERFELIASRDLEYRAMMQPGGDSLNLKIRVMLEEKRYFESPVDFRAVWHPCRPCLALYCVTAHSTCELYLLLRNFNLLCK